MEELISIFGIVAGVAGFATTFLSRIRISINNNSIEIKFGHEEEAPEVRISDISHLTVGEIEQLKAKLSDLQLENGEVTRRE